jgi:hypothetical protein
LEIEILKEKERNTKRERKKERKAERQRDRKKERKKERIAKTRKLKSLKSVNRCRVEY